MTGYYLIRELIKHFSTARLGVPVHFRTGIILSNWIAEEQSTTEKCNFHVINKLNWNIKYKATLPMRASNVLAHQA